MKRRIAPRIIAGKLKGHRLKSIPGNQTRPITDRVKENLFNIIGSDINRSHFLDVFAGTGSVGLEAYSRGAEFVQFIEKNKKPFLILKENLIKVSETSAFDLKLTDAFTYIRSTLTHSFDYIYIAPPQYHGMWEKALTTVDNNSNLLNKDGWIIVQIDPIEYKTIEGINLKEFDQRKYGNTLLIFFSKMHL